MWDIPHKQEDYASIVANNSQISTLPRLSVNAAYTVPIWTPHVCSCFICEASEEHFNVQYKQATVSIGCFFSTYLIKKTHPVDFYAFFFLLSFVIVRHTQY